MNVKSIALLSAALFLTIASVSRAELTVVGSFAAPGSSPAGLAYDGQYLWCSDTDSDTVFQLDDAGRVVASFDPQGNSPVGLAFDGTYLWSSDPAVDLLYLHETGGLAAGSFRTPDTDPRGLAFDGTYLWVAGDGTIYKVDTSGRTVDSFKTDGADPYGLAFDGTYLWCADHTEGLIYQYDTAGNVIASFQAPDTDPRGLAFDGTYLWCAVDGITDARDVIYQLALESTATTTSTAADTTTTTTSIASDTTTTVSGETTTTTFAADNATDADVRQALALSELAGIADPDVFRVRVEAGAVRRLNLNLDAALLSRLPYSPTSDDVALTFLATYPDLLRISSPEENFRMIKRAGNDFVSLHFRQYAEDIPVYGSWLQVRVEDRGSGSYRISNIAGRYVPDMRAPQSSPAITARDAEETVARKYSITNDALHTTVPTRLWFYDAALFAPGCPDCSRQAHDPRLAWKVVFMSPEDGGVAADAFVDALTGDILEITSRTYEGFELDVETVNGCSISKACWTDTTCDDAWFDEDGVCRYRWYCPFSSCCSNACADGWNCADPDAEGWLLDEYSRDNYRFYQKLYKRDSYNGAGEEFEMYVHLNNANAFSQDCGGFYAYHEFGNGFVTVDIVGHEVGHSFHRSETAYSYKNESGAIAEHVGDMFGVFVGYWTGKDADWIFGEGTPGATSGMRSLANPPAFSSGATPYPDHYTLYNNFGGSDNGGVHFNSSILNKAGYLISEGGVHNGISVTGIGVEKTRDIYYWTVVNKLPGNPGFSAFRDFVNDTCEETYDKTVECCAVKNAFFAVGIGDPDTDCDGFDDSVDYDDDGDGVSDSKDNCPLVPNGSQADTDGDALGDACDPDIDNDGLANDNDNCPYAANADQADSDADGIGEACDDDDGDGVVNLTDNCPADANQKQTDTDSDGQGDACDADIDNDGLLNEDDNCEAVSNAAQEDSDADTVGDACDNCIDEPNQDQGNVDGDDTGDACDDDIDGDGIVNAADSCPVNPGGKFDTDLNGCFDDWEMDAAKKVITGEMLFTALLEEPAFYSLPINPCAFTDCAEQALFARTDFLKLSIDMSLHKSALARLSHPVNMILSVVDEAGNNIAHVKAELNENSLDAAAELSFALLPSFVAGQSEETLNPRHTLRTDTGDSESALPAYYLAMGVDPNSRENIEVLAGSSLTFSVQAERTSVTTTVSDNTTASDAAADFAGCVSEDAAPADVAFTDSSAGDIVSWEWWFGDGDTGSDRNPVHTYRGDGNYAVMLAVADAAGNRSTASFNDCVMIGTCALSADFTATIVQGEAPLRVAFTSTTQDSVTHYQWFFGDGESSTQENPVHTYTSPGVYTVMLLVEDGTCAASSVKADVITVAAGGEDSCPVEQALQFQADRPQALAALRDVRDRVLATRAAGVLLTKLYYMHAAEITAIMEQDDRLRQMMTELIADLMPGVTDVLDGETASLAAGDLNRIASLADALAQSGSPALRNSLALALHMIGERSLLFKQIGIVVDTGVDQQ